jgi:hypothetical protein
MEELEPLVGEWSMEIVAPWAPEGDQGARLTFEWMEGKKFLVQRWTVPVPEAPDGIALIGYDEGRRTLLQHYFDTRGVARVYEMSFAAGVWELERTKPDFSDLDFSQRFRGELEQDGRVIEGRWEINHGEKWEKDFDLVYRKLSA